MPFQRPVRLVSSSAHETLYYKKGHFNKTWPDPAIAAAFERYEETGPVMTELLFDDLVSRV